jgi:DNA-binding MarR family transcriptional regulator
MHLWGRIRVCVPSPVSSVAAEFAELFPAVYLRFHVRRAKRGALGAQARGVLAHLALAGPLTVTEAALHMNRAQSAMSELISGLERKRLVARFADTRDRRRTLVWLTEAGQAQLAEDRRVLDAELVALALSGMKPEERRQLLLGMRALLRASDSKTNHQKEP